MAPVLGSTHYVQRDGRDALRRVYSIELTPNIIAHSQYTDCCRPPTLKLHQCQLTRRVVIAEGNLQAEVNASHRQSGSLQAGVMSMDRAFSCEIY